MEPNLFIEEYKEEEEILPVYHENLDCYCDDETNILVTRMRVGQNLEVGKIYTFTFEYEDDESEYDFLIIRKDDDGSYLMCQKYGGYQGKIYSVSNKALISSQIICNVKDKLGLDLSEWM